MLRRGSITSALAFLSVCLVINTLELGSFGIGVSGAVAIQRTVDGEPIIIPDTIQRADMRAALQQLESKLTLVTRYGLGDATKIIIRDDYLYFGSSSGLTIFDLSCPSSPQKLGSVFFEDSVRDMVLNGGYAFIANGRKGLRIVDVSNPLKPGIVGTHETPEATVAAVGERYGEAMAVATFDHYVVVGIRGNGMEIVDVQSVENPVAIAHYPECCDIYKVLMVGRYAYVFASCGPYVRLFDLSDPSNPTLVATDDIQHDGRVRTVQENGGYLYLGYYEGVFIYDIHEPKEPELVNSLEIKGTSFHVAGRYAFFSTGDYDEPLRVFDINDLTRITPLQPKLAHHWSPYWRQLYKCEDSPFLAVGTGGGFLIFKMETVPVLEFVGEYVERTVFGAVAGKRHFLYCPFKPHQHEALMLTLDVTDPQHPVNVSEIRWKANRHESARDLFCSDGRLYMAFGARLLIFDLSDPSKPRLTSEYDAERYISSICVQKRCALVATGRNRLDIVNVRNADNPELLASVDTAGYNGCVWASETTAFLSQDGKLRAIDIQRPSQPTLAASMQLDVARGDQIMGAEGDDKILYVPGRNKLHILDVSVPSEPSILSTYSCEQLHNSTGVSLEDKLLFVSAQEGLFVFDVADPHNPDLVGRFPVSGLRDIILLGGLVYLPNGRDLCVLEWKPGLESVTKVSIESNVLQESRALLDQFQSRFEHTACWYGMESLMEWFEVRFHGLAKIYGNDTVENAILQLLETDGTLEYPVPLIIRDHLEGLLAERSRRDNRVVSLEELYVQ